MLEFLVDNIFVVFAARLPADSRHSNGYELCPSSRRHLSVFIRSGFHKSLLSTGKKQIASRFNLTCKYIDDILSINNPEFENQLCQMYHAELQIKDNTESTTSASYLDLLLSIGRNSQLHTSIYDNRDDFNFHITNFPFLSSNIPSLPASGVFISQLIRYARACNSYEFIILVARRLSSTLLKQGYPWNAWNRHSRSLMVDTRILFNNKCHSDLWPTVTSQSIRLSTNFMTLIQSLTFTELWVVSMEHWQRLWHTNRERLLFRTPGSIPSFLDFLVLQLLRPDFSNLPCLYSTFHLEYPSVLSLFCFTLIHLFILKLEPDDIDDQLNPCLKQYT